MRARPPILALLLGLLVAAPARGERELPVRLDPFRFSSGAPPAGWIEANFDDRGWGGPAAGPFAPRPPPRPDLAPPKAPATPVTFYDLTSGAPLLLRARFAVAEPAKVRVLELRIAYADGFVAYVNGREVARRGIGEGALGPALVPHGPEIERVTIPVGSSAPVLQTEGNLLAIAVFPYAKRSATVPVAPAATVSLGAADGVRIVRGPYLIAPSQTRDGVGVKVAWETDLPATGTVTVERADPTPANAPADPPRRLAAPSLATRQVVAVTGLRPAAAYRYRVAVDAGAGGTASAAPARFETVAGRDRPFRFAVYGDMRYPGHAAHRQVVEGLLREAPALVLNTGDLTDIGSEESNWQRYFDITAPLGAIAPIVPALGNHDAARGGQGSARAWALFGVPAAPPPGWTSLDLGGVHFVLLDTNVARDPAQRAWLAEDLRRARQAKARAIFAFCHEAPWSHGLHGPSELMIRDYTPLLAAGGVDVLFCGHDHIYERGTGVTPKGKLTYVVTGGGGAPLYNPRCRARTGPDPGDVPGPLPPCPATVAALVKTHHYVIVEVKDRTITLCPRRPDGTPVEPCVPLPARR